MGKHSEHCSSNWKRARGPIQDVTVIDTTSSSASHSSRVSSQEDKFGLSIVSVCPDTWIIDSAATGYMTSNSSIIDSLTSSSVKFVQVAKRTLCRS